MSVKSSWVCFKMENLEVEEEEDWPSLGQHPTPVTWCLLLLIFHLHQRRQRREEHDLNLLGMVEKDPCSLCPHIVLLRRGATSRPSGRLRLPHRSCRHFWFQNLPLPTLDVCIFCCIIFSCLFCSHKLASLLISSLIQTPAFHQTSVFY